MSRLSSLKNKFSTSTLIKGASSALFLRVTNMGLGLITSVLLGRILGAGEYGVYAYVLSILNLLSIPTTLGLPELIVRNIAIFQTKEQWGLFRGLLIRSNQVVIISSLFLIAIIFAAVKFLEYPSAPVNYDVLFVGLAILPFIGLSSLRSATLRGLRLIFLSQVSESLVQPFIFLASFFWVYLYWQEINLDSMIVMQLRVISVFIAFCFGAFLLFRNIPKKLKGTKVVYRTTTWGRSALSFMFIGGVMFINNQFDILMLGIFRSNSEVGIYKIVTVGASLVVFCLMAVNMALAPIIARLYSKGEKEELQKMLTFSARVTIIGTLPVAFVFIYAGGALLNWVYGAEYVQGAGALSILTGAQVLNSAFGSVALLLNMTGNERYVFKGQIISALLNVSLNYLLIPEWGMKGAAIATSISMIVWNIILFLIVYKRLQLNTTAFRWASI